MQLIANLSLLFTELPVLERLAAARQAGFTAVEIQFPYTIPAEVLRQELDAHGLEIILFNLPVGDLMQGGLGLACQPTKQEEFHSALQQALAYALIAQPKKVNLLSGRLEPQQDADLAFITLVNNARAAAMAFAPLNIEVVAEAINPIDMPNFFVQTPAQQLALIHAVAHANFKAQVDVYHMARQGLCPLTVLQELSVVLGHVQFADFPGRNEPGTGELDFAAILQQLDSQNYTGGWAAEYNPSTSTAESLGWLNSPVFCN